MVVMWQRHRAAWCWLQAATPGSTGSRTGRGFFPSVEEQFLPYRCCLSWIGKPRAGMRCTGSRLHELVPACTGGVGTLAVEKELLYPGCQERESHHGADSPQLHAWHFGLVGLRDPPGARPSPSTGQICIAHSIQSCPQLASCWSSEGEVTRMGQKPRFYGGGLHTAGRGKCWGQGKCCKVAVLGRGDSGPGAAILSPSQLWAPVLLHTVHHSSARRAVGPPARKGHAHSDYYGMLPHQGPCPLPLQ